MPSFLSSPLCDSIFPSSLYSLSLLAPCRIPAMLASAARKMGCVYLSVCACPFTTMGETISKMLGCESMHRGELWPIKPLSHSLHCVRRCGEEENTGRERIELDSSNGLIMLIQVARCTIAC